MQLFACDNCHQSIFFDNYQCTNCGYALAFLPELCTMSALEPIADEVLEGGQQAAPRVGATTPDASAGAPVEPAPELGPDAAAAPAQQAQENTGAPPEAGAPIPTRRFKALAG